MYTKEGIRAFFRGYSSSFIVHCMYSFSWWSSYSILRRDSLKFEFVQDFSPLVFDAVTGAIAGVVSSLATHPLDTIKMQIQTGHCPTEDIVQAMKGVLRKTGIRTLYHGLSASLLTGALSSAVFCITCDLALFHLSNFQLYLISLFYSNQMN